MEATPFEDTIVAVSTPPGRGALGIVRVSGPGTIGVLERFCRNAGGAKIEFRESSRKALYCKLATETGEFIDEGIVVYYPGPASYTGEDMAEISLHGNPLLLRDFTLSVARMPGLRLAEPGEYTRRAFLNGKIDLPRAEAVRRLIEARGEYELAASKKLLSGELSRLVSRFRSDLMNLKAETEAEVDFSDEDLTFESREERSARVRTMIASIDEIQSRSSMTSRMIGGFQIALAGIPNAGKSSLMNLMLGWDRAIVSPLPSTTRDYLTEEFHIDGVAVRIVDTAGIRKTQDDIESEGIRRSFQEIERSQIILHVIDGSLPAYELPAIESSGTVIPVINKKDILHESSWSRKMGALQVSCKTGEGLHDLQQALRDVIFSEPTSRDPLLLEDRHAFHFTRVREALEKVLLLWEENAPDEITALEIDQALDHMGEITGRISNEEILGRIFSMFCVGK